MPVLVDANVLIAALSRADANHARAMTLIGDLLRGRHGEALVTAEVLDEGLTFLRGRVGREEVSRAFLSYVDLSEAPGEFALVPTTTERLEEAVRLHFRHWDRKLSLTDCTLVAHAHALDGAVATFDDAFEGIVETVR